jgi:hypothetical protein
MNASKNTHLLRNVLSLALFSPLTLAPVALGCAHASAPSAASVAETPAPEAVPPTRAVALTAGPQAAGLTLACQREEPSLRNGVDDDCDGRVDGEPAPSEQVLSVSLVRAPDVDVVLMLRRSDGQVVTPSRTRATGVCEAAAPFALTRADYDALEPGTYEVVLTRVATCQGNSKPFTHATIWTADEKPQRLALGVSLGAEPVVLATAEVR